jgi:ribonuclease T2
MFGRIFNMTMIAVLVMVGAAGTVSARHRHHSSDAATPGVFDYYLLSLSWSPAYCLQAPGAAECNGPRRFGFIVHGLWPQYERGWPEKCGEAPIPDSVVDKIADLMPARGLVYHEWSAHGTCSGLVPADFFALIRRAHDAVAIPASLTSPAAAVERSPGDIVREFMQSNPNLPARSVVATCSGQGAPRLREVHVCFDRNLRARACSEDALRSGCRVSSVIVPPIR